MCADIDGGVLKTVLVPSQYSLKSVRFDDQEMVALGTRIPKDWLEAYVTRSASVIDDDTGQEKHYLHILNVTYILWNNYDAIIVNI